MENHQDDYELDDRVLDPSVRRAEQSAPQRTLRAARRDTTLPGRLRAVRDSFDFSLHEVDKTLLILLVLLVFFGLVMVTSTASYTIIRRGQESILGFIGKQVFLAGVGFAAMFFMAALDYHRLNWKLLLLLAPAVVILNILPRFIGPNINGAHRWLDLGFTTMQPSELAKYYMAVLAACLMASPGKATKKSMVHRYVLVWAFVAVFIFIIAVVQSNLSTSAILAMAAFLVVIMSQAPLLWNLIPMVLGLLTGAMLVVKTGYRWDRLFGFLHPFSDPTGKTLQVVQSLYALSMGGLLGRGLGNSRFKAFWLPYAENDFIFAIIAEELGLIGGLAVIGVFAYLVLTGLRIGRQARDAYGRLLSVGIISIIAIQALINMAVVMGAFPVTGVPLPFISAGGTSLIVNLAAMGILLNISRQKR